MPDVFTKTKRSQIMAAIRSTGNKATELKLAATRPLLHHFAVTEPYPTRQGP